MDDNSHVRFVDTHSESVCRHHHFHFIFLPQGLSVASCHRVETGMIERGSGADACQSFGIFLCLFPVVGVYNSGTVDSIKYFHRFGKLVFCLSYDVGKVLSFETHSEHVFFSESELLLNVVYGSLRCRGGKCENWDAGLHLSYLCYGEIGRPEVISPLAYAVGFVYGDEAYVHMLQFCEKQFGSESFG